jgi:hypothetical protein
MQPKLHPILEALRAPFPASAVSWRPGTVTKDGKKCKPLAYIDARDVQDRLDEVLGLGWSSEFVPMPNGTACCKITIQVDGLTIWRSNGAEMLTKSDNTDVQEMSIKGSYSDAFKRAAVMFGVGQYLYAADAPWVEIDDNKRLTPTVQAKLTEWLARKFPVKAPAQRAADRQEINTDKPGQVDWQNVPQAPSTGAVADDQPAASVPSVPMPKPQDRKLRTSERARQAAGLTPRSPKEHDTVTGEVPFDEPPRPDHRTPLAEDTIPWADPEHKGADATPSTQTSKAAIPADMVEPSEQVLRALMRNLKSIALDDLEAMKAYGMRAEAIKPKLTPEHLEEIEAAEVELREAIMVYRQAMADKAKANTPRRGRRAA